MKVTLQDTTCLVEKEPGDPSCRGAGNAAGESRLLYHVKRVLNARGYDFVKVRMWKDGHLVDEMKQYLRERKIVNGRQLAIFNDRWAIKGADEPFNRYGKVELRVQDIALSEVESDN